MIRYPSITGRTTEQQLEQMKKALFTLVDQINQELDEIRRKENSNGGNDRNTRG